MPTDNTKNTQNNDAVNDLSPLAWVLDELRKSLDTASRNTKRFVQEAEALNSPDPFAADVNLLRSAAKELHQASGVLQMLLRLESVQLVKAMEDVLQRWVQSPALATDVLTTQLEFCGFAVMEYLECLIAGKALPAVALFSQYQQIKQLLQTQPKVTSGSVNQTGKNQPSIGRIHPADLWFFGDFEWLQPTMPEDNVGGKLSFTPLDYSEEVADRVAAALLSMLRHSDVAGAVEMKHISLGLFATQTNPQARVFWAMCSGVFEAIGEKLLPMDLYVKRLTSGVVLHYNNMRYGSWIFSQKFMHDLLFFCNQAALPHPDMAPHLAAIKHTWRLYDTSPVNYDIKHYGHFDPALLTQARKRIAIAQELWTGLSAGDTHKIRSTVEQFKLVSESLLKLYSNSQNLAQAMTRTTDAILLSKEAPHPELAIEVATALLYLNALFDGWRASETDMESRMNAMAQRIDHVRIGGKPEPVEPWVENLYRRVSEKQSLDSVVGELHLSLKEVEKAIDQYFRLPTDSSPLRYIPAKLQQMRGTFSLLGLDAACSTVSAMRDDVEDFLTPDFDFYEALFVGKVDKLGNNLGALGFLIDMLNHQPVLVKRLFVFDVKTKTLDALMGRATRHMEANHVTAETEKAVHASMEKLIANPVVVIPATATILVATAVSTTPTISMDMPAQPVVSAPAFAMNTTMTEIAQAMDSLQLPVQQEKFIENIPTAALVEALPPSKTAKIELPEEEQELLDIFLIEAEEVVGNGLQAVKLLGFDGNHLEQQAILRRVFHTLKGSSRMVGLMDFGNAGWAFEQMLNTRLADQTSFDTDFCQVAEMGLHSFADWVADLVKTGTSHWDAAVFIRCADAMRIRNRLDVDGLINPKKSAPKVQHEYQPQAPQVAFSGTEIEKDLMFVQKPTDPHVDFSIDFSAIDFASFGQTASTQDGLTEKKKPEQFLTNETLQQRNVQPPHQIEDEDETTNITTATSIEIPVLDEYKTIGHLSLRLPLFLIYSQEATQWAKRLMLELTQWQNEWQRPLTISTINAAHSLAGSSGTVGFDALSQLAKALELALEYVYHRPQGNLMEIGHFIQAAKSCESLLLNFTEGNLTTAPTDLLTYLLQLPLGEISAESLKLKGIQSVAHNQNKNSDDDGKTRSTHNVSTPTQIPVNAIEITNEHHQTDDVDLDVVDSLDMDLFGIFTDEAEELLPKLGTSLRKWQDQPNVTTPRLEVLRILHTLKGSARLAGAMRLGEWAHRMESEIESIGSQQISHADVENLQDYLDHIQHNFEQLQNPSVVDEILLDMSESVSTSINDAEDLLVPTPVLAAIVSFDSNSTPNNTSGSDNTVALSDHFYGSDSGKETSKFVAAPAVNVLLKDKKENRQSVRVQAKLLDNLLNQAGEVMLTRTRLASEIGQLKGSLGDLSGNLDRLRQQLRDVEVQAETQMQSRMEQTKSITNNFDPLEFDRFTRVQELTRMMAESVSDVATVQRNLQRTVEVTEDDLIAQARQTRDLQRDLLRTRMDEFESISDRLYRVVRQTAKELGKQTKLELIGGSIELDRGVLERMTGCFEHILRNCIAHGIETPQARTDAGKNPLGTITIAVRQDGNDIEISFSDDGAGLDLSRILQKAIENNLLAEDTILTKENESTIGDLIFSAGLSTAQNISEVAGRGIGLDVVRSEVTALGGHVDVAQNQPCGTQFTMVLPLTTAVTQVVMVRTGNVSFGIPSHLIELIRRVTLPQLQTTYQERAWLENEHSLPFYWMGALLQLSQRSSESHARNNSLVLVRSAGQRLALHVDEVFGNTEVVVKNLGTQLSRLPGLAGMAVLASGTVALIYNPVALAAVYGKKVEEQSNSTLESPDSPDTNPSGITTFAILPIEQPKVHEAPLIMVVDDSITVRRVTQRMLQREGFRVLLAVDGLDALSKLSNEELPLVVLSDIEMPRMDGFDLARNIRNEDRLKHLPLFMITSRIAEKHRELAKSLGVDHYLGKPYSEEVLLMLIRETLQKISDNEENTAT